MKIFRDGERLFVSVDGCRPGAELVMSEDRLAELGSWVDLHFVKRKQICSGLTASMICKMFANETGRTVGEGEIIATMAYKGFHGRPTRVTWSTDFVFNLELSGAKLAGSNAWVGLIPGIIKPKGQLKFAKGRATGKLTILLD